MLLNTLAGCALLTMIIMRRASIMPSIMYKLLVNPPAHKGPNMVARPPTERLTPWLNPFGEASWENERLFLLSTNIEIWLEKKNTACIIVSLHHICWAAAICCFNMLNRANSGKTSQPCVFSAVTLEKRDTWDTATKGSPSSCRNTPMMKADSSHPYPPGRDGKIIPWYYWIIAVCPHITWTIPLNNYIYRL